MRALAKRSTQGGECRIHARVVERKYGTRLRPERLERVASTPSSAMASAIVACPRSRPEVGEQRMPGVEQPELAALERLDVVDEPGADRVPAGPSAGERAAQHPFAERLGDDRRRVVRSPVSAQHVRGRRRWSPA